MEQIYNKDSISRITYKKKLQTICSYFEISYQSAKYIYHRRRRGMPFNKLDSENYIGWSAQLQNALIKADAIDKFNWKSLAFGYEETVLKSHNIIVSEQSDSYTKQSDSFNEDSDDEWAVVTKQTNLSDILVQLHLLK